MTRRTAIGAIAIAAAVIGVVAWTGLVGAGDGEDERLAKADEIATRVSELRGLDIKTEIDRGVMTKDQVRARIRARLGEQYTDAELKLEAMALERMGMLPRNADLEKLVLDLLTDNVAGFYDSKEAKLYIAGWGTQKSDADAVMAHEIDHALQDQHFDLDAMLTTGKNKRKLTGDEMSARQALVEGDGMALMIEYSTSNLGIEPWGNDAVLDMMLPTLEAQTSSGSMARAPLVLRESLAFPYVAGLRFVAEFRKNHTWSRVDDIYGKLPLSTEHILHVDRYVVYEKPDAVDDSLPAVLGDDGFTRVYSDVIGEHGLSLLLRQHGVRTTKAETSAAGWGGDRIVVYGPAGHDGRKVSGTVGVVYTVWDHEADAMEFYESMTDAISSLANGGKSVTEDDDLVVHMLGSKTVVSVERDGDAVVVIVGAPKDSAKDLRKQVWAWKVSRAK